MSSLQKPKRTFHLFYSYAEEDKLLLNKLEKHLGFLKQLGEIQGWDRRNVSGELPYESFLLFCDQWIGRVRHLGVCSVYLQTQSL